MKLYSQRFLYAPKGAPSRHAWFDGQCVARHASGTRDKFGATVRKRTMSM